MSSEKLLCECGNEFTERDFSHHYGKCERFMRQFDEFDKVFGRLLKTYSHPRSRLRIIRFLIKEYIKVIDMKAPINSEGRSTTSSISNPLKNSSNIGYSSVCQMCSRNNDLIYLNCLHPICRHVFANEAEKNICQMKCRQCGKLIEERVKKQILGNNKYEELLKKNNSIISLSSGNGKIIQCPKCREKSYFEEGGVDYNIRDSEGKKMSKEACEDFAKHRVRCGFCQSNFCVDCQTIPYHLGKTCSEHKRFLVSVKCRFCGTMIKSNNQGPENDVCNDQDCKERFGNACKKVLHCGHKCFGVKNEKSCPPCIVKECPGYRAQFDQKIGDYCPICFSEGLESAPFVVLSCGHYVHYHCLKKRLETKWIGPNITFKHNNCPSCNKWFTCKEIPELQKMVDENILLYNKVKDMALKRLVQEHLDKDTRLTDRRSQWYGKKAEFAMKRLSFYQCYICKNPYFAGRRECGDNPGNLDENNQLKDYDPKHLICGKHANLFDVKGVSNCKTHGKEYIEYKCKFCCRIASWFCWGDTHFCEDCHKRQCAGDYVSKIPKNKLPICNPNTCEVGGNHPPNGEEYAIGCLLCRSAQEAKK